MTETSVLIVTYADDPHADAVESALPDSVERFRLNTDRLPYDHGVTYDNGSFVLTDLERQIHLSERWVIWNRRIVMPELEDVDPKLHSIIEAETRETLEGLIDSHPGTVINRVSDNRRASNKISQFAYVRENARELLPETLITNDPSRFVRFYQAHPSICHKQQKMTVIDDEGGKVAYTNIVRDEHVAHADRIAWNPCYFQEYERKDHEVRVSVIGDVVLPVAIDSQRSPISSVDFRRYDFDRVRYSRTELPTDVSDLCRDVTHAFGLRFSQIDLIKRPNDSYVFLEMNPNGQWLWLEELGGAPISQAIADELVS